MFHLRRRPDPQDTLPERITTLAGLVTLAIGTWMVIDPARAGHALALRDDPRRTRLGGLLDLTLAPGLLAARRRRPWMIARAAFNAGFAVNQRRPQRALSAALTVLDAAVATRLAGD